MNPGHAIAALWIAWATSWVVAMLWSARTVKRPPLRSQLPYRVLMVTGAAVLFAPAHGAEGAWRLWHVDRIGGWLCAAAVAAGLCFAWWARLHLGSLWSSTVTRKAEHRVVVTGSYALVRHPIYTGLLLGLLASAAANGTAFGVVGFLIWLAGVWLKARQEETWLAQELSGAYAEYRARVPMLVPRFRARSREVK